jgi:hypothetical protein
MLMLKAIEGVYKNGKIELDETPSDILDSRVIVTFLEKKSTLPAEQMIRFGMFAGSIQSTEDDFQMAQFQGDSNDGLDWS